MRDDMFSWLLGKKLSKQAKSADRQEASRTVGAEAEPEVEVLVPEPSAQAPQRRAAEEPQDASPPASKTATAPAIAVRAEAPAEASSSSAPVPPVATPSPTTAAKSSVAPATARCSPAMRPSKAMRLITLGGAGDKVDLRAGLAVIEQAGRQLRPGVLIAVRANGRRLLASLEAAGRIRAYTLRRDGTYRLEGANNARAPALRLASEA